MFALHILTGTAILASIGSASGATKVVLTNDDGWAVANIRAKYTALVNAGFDVVLSAPAVDMSGTGSSDATPTKLDSQGCEFKSCPAGAPAEGADASNSRLNYCNSYPATSVRYGIQEVAPKFWSTKPDLVLSGPNVGANLGSTVLISGTVGAATEAAKEGIPAIAFSGDGGSFVSFTTLTKSSSATTTANVYADLGVKLTNALLSTATLPILPPGIALNVNYPEARGSCTTASAFKFILTRINKAKSGEAADVSTCGSTRLPTETSIVDMDGCLASVSVMNATTKGDVDSATQQVVLSKLKSILSCA